MGMPLAFSVAGTLKAGEIPALLRQQETGNRGSGQLNSGLFERKFRAQPPRQPPSCLKQGLKKAKVKNT